MDEFGRRFVCLVVGTTLGTVAAGSFVSDSTVLLEYATVVAASALISTGLYRSSWLQET